mmetsp:Transcript_5621/g.10241  ORF Transcript_5621/g.10241 Transcript_5621/m.10241 type:complete len:89 (+) Transcript_5621:126-392(+)
MKRHRRRRHLPLRHSCTFHQEYKSKEVSEERYSPLTCFQNELLFAASSRATFISMEKGFFALCFLNSTETTSFFSFPSPADLFRLFSL